MSRSIYKGPYISSSLIRKITKLKTSGTDFTKTPIKTYARSSQIIPSFVGKIFEIHNGKRFIRVYVTENMIGHKLGEFSPTRVVVQHSGDKGKNKPKPVKRRK